MKNTVKRHYHIFLKRCHLWQRSTSVYNTWDAFRIKQTYTVSLAQDFKWYDARTIWSIELILTLLQSRFKFQALKPWRTLNVILRLLSFYIPLLFKKRLQQLMLMYCIYLNCTHKSGINYKVNWDQFNYEILCYQIHRKKCILVVLLPAPNNFE